VIGTALSAKRCFAIQQQFERLPACERARRDLYRDRKEPTTPNPKRFLTKRVDESTIEVDALHLSPVSHPQQIVDFILKAVAMRNSA